MEKRAKGFAVVIMIVAAVEVVVARAVAVSVAEA